MNHRMNFMAAVACVAVLTGCDWGGVDSDEAWNDAYSWLNFSDTYTLSNPGNFESIDLGGEEKGEVKAPGDGSTKFNGTIPGLNGKIGDGIVPGSVTVKLEGQNDIVGEHSGITLKDDGKGNFKGPAPADGGIIAYSTGAFSAWAGSIRIESVSVSYSYYAKKTGTSGPYNVTFLHVSQRGNLFTMKDSNGTVFNGRITGASLPKDNYSVASDVRLAFEVASDNGDKIVGNFTGHWSGAPSGSTGVLSSRILNGTFYHGGEHDDIHGESSTSVNLTPPAKPDTGGNGGE